MNVYRKIEEGEMRIQMVGHTIQCVFLSKTQNRCWSNSINVIVVVVCVRACFSFTVFFSPTHSISHSFHLALLLLLSFENFYDFVCINFIFLLFFIQYSNYNIQIVIGNWMKSWPVCGVFFFSLSPSFARSYFMRS